MNEGKMPETRVSNGDFRSPYYNMSDVLIGLMSAAEDAGDKKLLQLLMQVDNIVDKIHKHLDDIYLWD